MRSIATCCCDNTCVTQFPLKYIVKTQLLTIIIHSFNFTAINIYVDKEYTDFYFTVISFQEEWLKFDQVLLVLSNSTKPM